MWAPPAAAAFDALDARDPRMADRLLAALTRYALTGQGDVRPLTDRPGYRLRAGEWRVLFTHDATRHELLVRAIANRRDVYRP